MIKSTNVRTFGISLCLVLFAVGLMVPVVKALSGDFYLGASTMSKEIWSSSSPRHIRVTVTVTSADADTYADQQPSSVLAETDNKEVTLHNGDTEIIEDFSAKSVVLYERAGIDHNLHSYYGISGKWEVTVLSGGGDGVTLTLDSNQREMAIVGAVTVAIIAVGFIAAMIIRKKRKQKAAPSQPATPVSGRFCSQCGTQNEPAAAYCKNCGNQLSK